MRTGGLVDPGGRSCEALPARSFPTSATGSEAIDRGADPAEGPGHAGVPRTDSKGGSSGWAAMVTPACSATGMMSSRKRPRRSQSCSWVTGSRVPSASESTTMFQAIELGSGRSSVPSKMGNSKVQIPKSKFAAIRAGCQCASDGAVPSLSRAGMPALLLVRIMMSRTNRQRMRFCRGSWRVIGRL